VSLEAVILVRIDNMDTLTVVGQASIRFDLDDGASTAPENLKDAIRELVALALEQAPPITEWPLY
jgi:hypothetical protein